LDIPSIPDSENPHLYAQSGSASGGREWEYRVDFLLMVEKGKENLKNFMKLEKGRRG